MSRSSRDSIDRTRRSVLASLAAAPAIAGLSACGSAGDGNSGDPSQPPPGVTLPDPKDSGIDHIVVVMMENRSFDHYLGWVPGADGKQAGLSFRNIEGSSVETFRLSQDAAYGYQGCGWADPNHGYDGGRTHLADGAMNGWLLTDGTSANPQDRFPVGYFTGDDLPFFKGVAENWTICDRYFSGILSSTYPNRFYQHAGQTDRMTNTSDISSLPTIWDRLSDAGLTGRYYFSDLPITALWGTKYLGISQPTASFFLSAAAGLLPDLCFVEPRFLVEYPLGTSNDDHPVADVRDGQAFLNSVYEALRTSPAWDRTLLIVNYDEWGGFYDHVVPPFAPISDAEASLGNDGRLGFRVPCAIIGPRAKRGVVSHQFDPCSILNFITWRFGLEPIGPRAQSSLNLAYALDFDSVPRTDTPAFDVPTGPFGLGCGLTSAGDLAMPNVPDKLLAESHFGEWLLLKQVARRYGFPVSS
jgi:phospholipase C